jgi:hypothetical protein
MCEQPPIERVTIEVGRRTYIKSSVHGTSFQLVNGARPVTESTTADPGRLDQARLSIPSLGQSLQTADVKRALSRPSETMRSGG